MNADIVESLMRGATEYPRAFVAAKAFWDQFYGQNAGASASEMKTAIDGAQAPFQWDMEEKLVFQPPLRNR
ncbi:hypothetical protein NKH94_30470 [Mesorhizobium australicum]|uniref:hypothetical protein n=1 Tax=Mesorhizobium australicum TaxID=536018 RepID=UPI00333BA2EF